MSKRAKTCKVCGKNVALEEDFSWWGDQSSFGLHPGHCYDKMLNQIEYDTSRDNRHFIRFNDDGIPLEPVTRMDALNEVKRIQNLCYIILTDLEKHDKFKAERYLHELES